MTAAPSPSTPELTAIVDYGAGNLRSVQKSFERAAAALDARDGRARDIIVTCEAAAIARADRLVLPGVGAFAACAAGLNAAPGVIDALRQSAIDERKPFLGICVGMQLLATCGLEFGETPGLDWIGGSVKRLEAGPDRRIPHMGWNTVIPTRAHPVFDALGDAVDLYFVHSFYFDVENAEDCAAVCAYGGDVAAAVARDNILGVQFHPEKSQAAGLEIIDAFLRWTP